MSCINIAAEFLFQELRVLSLSSEAGCSACLWEKGGVEELGDALLGRVCHLPANRLDALCLQQTLALWIIVACLRFLLLQIVKNLLIWHLWKGLMSTWHFSSGICLDLALEWHWWTWLIPVEGKKSDVSTNIIRSVICLEVQELWDIND